MGVFLPSEVARLVLGYLEEQGCMRAYDEFLNGCRHLEECRGRGFFTRIMGLSLLDILDEYCAIHSHILKVDCAEDFKKRVLRCQSLLEKVKLFVDDNDGNSKINTYKLSQSVRSVRDTPSKGHKTRHVRSNSCDSVITIKTEKSYSRTYRAASNERSPAETERHGNHGRCHIHHITRSNESLAEATNLADLPGNKRFSRCNCEPVGISSAPRGMKNVPSASTSHRNSSAKSKPSCSNTYHDSTQTDKENVNKSPENSKSRTKCKPMGQEELKFRKALGLTKLPDVSDKSFYKTPAKKIVSKLKECSTIKKTNATDYFPSDSFNVTTMTNTLLDCTELHEKLAENINKLYNSTASKMADDSTIVNTTQYHGDQSLARDVDKDPNNHVTNTEDDIPQFFTVVKSIVDKTEEDPIFDQLLNDVLAAQVDTSSDSDVLSRPGTSTPEKSCYSQLSVSSAPSWICDKNKSTLEDKQRVNALKAQPKSINMLNISPHKSFIRNRRFPRGGKRMDVLRENYTSNMEYENKEDNSSIASSTNSNSPTMEVHRDPIPKSNQNIIILSNEVVQTHLMPNNGPLVIQKAQERSLPSTNQTDKSVEALQSQVDKVVWREVQDSGSQTIPPSQEFYYSASQSTSQQSTASAGSTGSQQPTSLSLANQPPISLQRDVQSHTKTNVIPSDQGQMGRNNFVSTHCKVPFVPGMVRYLSHLPAAAKPPVPSTEMLPPVSSTKSYSEVTFSSSASQQQADTNMAQSGSSSLRTFRRNIVTGKPPDIVISNSKVSGTSSLTSNCYSEEEIMKMPTIIVLPTGHSENKSDCDNRRPGTVSTDSEILSGNMAQLLPKILPAPIPATDANKSENIQKSTIGVEVEEIQPCNIKWTPNAPPNNTHTPAEVSSLLPMDISKTEKINIYFGPHLSMPDATASTCNLPADETNLSSNYLQGMFMPKNTCNIQSNASSEDDHFIIDEGHKSIEIEAAPVFQTLTENSSQKTNTLNTNVVESEEAKILDQLESKRASTPDLIIGKRTSASTPRRSFTHVRVLDFNTPPRNSEDGSRQTQSSPKQSLRTHGTTTKARNLRPKAHNVKSQLFPTIPELPAQGNVEKPRRSRTESKEKTVLPVSVKSTQCKVMKPRRSSIKSTEVAATEESVSNVWDDVQGMGQILKDDSSGVKKSKKSTRKFEKKENASENSGSDSEEDTDDKSVEAKEIKEDPEMEKKRKAEEAAAEWARIRSIDKKCWDQEMRSIVSFNHPKVEKKPKIVKKVRRKITKSTVPTSKVVKALENDELSKSTEDEGKLLENALNKSRDSECAETPLKDTSAGVIIPCENTDILSPTKLKGETSMYPIDDGHEEENSCVSNSKNLNTITLEGGSLPVMEDSSNLPESDNMSNTNYLLHIKLLRESRAKNGSKVGTEKKGKKPKPDNITRPIMHKKIKSTIKVKMNCKNSLDDRSNKESNIEATNKNSDSSKKSKSKQKGRDSSKDIQPKHLLNKTEGKHPTMEAPTCVEVHQEIDYKPKLAVNLEPPIPQVKITPDMPRESELYPMNAKYNLASLLETPLKCGILDLHLETPKFKISPGFFNEIGLSSALKLLEMPTPNFPTPLLAGLTPRTTAKDCTPGSCSSRPTDYSGSSSYYKPDEIEFDPEHAEFVIKTAAMTKTTANQPEAGEAEIVEKQENSPTIPKRVLRPRSAPKVYYPPQVISAPSKNKSLPRNTSSDKPGTSEVKSKKKTPAKEDISMEMYISTDSSSSFCSTCSSSDDEPILEVPPTEIKTRKRSTSTPIKTVKIKKNSRVQVENSPYKVLSTLQQLEEKRMRVIGKLNSSRGESFKKETKTDIPKKPVQNSQLSLKKTQKPVFFKTKVVKIPSLVVEQNSTTTKLTSSTDKSCEELIDPVNCPSNILAKSRRKSTTPRKLSTDKKTAQVQEVMTTQVQNAPIKGAKKTSESKEKKINTQDQEDVIHEKEASSVDKRFSDATNSQTYPSSGDSLHLNLHGPNVTHAVSDKVNLAESSTALIVPSILLHSPKSSKPSEEDLDCVTLHLSSDDADVESIGSKSQSDVGDITQIQNFIANSSSESGKTAFQKNLEMEGFDEISAKMIEKDLTDSVEFDEIFTGNCSNKLDISANQCYNKDSNISNNNGKASTQDKSVYKANSSSETDQKSTSTISAHKNLEEKGTGKDHKHIEINKATAYKASKCSEKYTCNVSTDVKIDNAVVKQENDVLHALEICKKDNQCSVVSVPKESTKCAASEIKNHNYTSKISSSNSSIKGGSETLSKSSSTSKNHYKHKEKSSSRNKSQLKIRTSGIEKNKYKSTNEMSKSEIQDSSLQRNNESQSTNSQCSAQLLPRATNKMIDVENKALLSQSTSTTNILKPTSPHDNPATKLAENPDIDAPHTVYWRRSECHSKCENFLQIVGQEPTLKKKIKKLTVDSRQVDTFRVSAEIYNSAIDTEQVRVFNIEEFKELLIMKPDPTAKRRVLRQEAVALKKRELLISKGSAASQPLDLLIEEMSKSTQVSPASNNLNISERNVNIPKDSELDVSFDTETANAVNSILFEDANNVFVYTPVKYDHGTDGVEAACETLTKAIIEDDFVEQPSEDKVLSSSEVNVESPQKSDDEELQNIIRMKQNSTNIQTSKKSKVEFEKINDAMAMGIQEYIQETRQMRIVEHSENYEEPLENLNKHSEIRKEEFSDKFNELSEKLNAYFDESKEITNNKEFAVISGEPNENRNINFEEKGDELMETSNKFVDKYGMSSKKRNPIVVEVKVDGLRDKVNEDGCAENSGELSENMNTNLKGNELMEKINEKRKRQDYANEKDDDNAKKIKIDAKQLFKQLDIESILEKLHGH